MDKNSKDFKNCKIYQVRNTVTNDIYIGGTCQQLRMRMAIYRKCSVSHNGLFYEEMRRLGKEQFYIELVEEYPCENKYQLTARKQYYIRDRGTLNNRTQTDASEPNDARHHFSELKVLMHELHTRILHIEGKLESLLNNLYPSETSTQVSDDAEETETINTEIETMLYVEPEPISASIPESELPASSLQVFDIADSDEHESEQSSVEEAELTPCALQIFDMAELNDIEVESPNQIETHDLTEKRYLCLRNKIPDHIVEALETGSYMKTQLWEARELHPNDKDRVEHYERVDGEHNKWYAEAFRYYAEYREANPNDETNIHCDLMFVLFYGDISSKGKKHKKKNNHKRRR